MKRVQWINVTAVTLLLFCANPRTNTVANKEIHLTFAPLPMESGGRVNTIRLVSDDGRPTLATLEDSADGAPQVSLVPLDGSGTGRSRSLFRLESPFGTPSWDVARTQVGMAAVWTKPGSAISPLGYRTSNGSETVLTGQYSLGVFQNPRFVRGEPAGAVTAVAYEGSDRVVALFRDSLQSGQSRYVRLPSDGSGMLLDALLLREGSGYLLFTKLLPPGSRGPERRDLRGESIQPGVLRCRRLTEGLQPASISLAPIGDTSVFEFDVDAVDRRVFLLATTPEGYITGIATAASSASMEWTTALGPRALTEFLAPSVIAGPNGVFAAVAASAGPNRVQILIGHY